MKDPYHRLSSHTWASVRQAKALDWHAQPSTFKQYPARFPVQELSHLPKIKDFLSLCAGITARKSYPGGFLFLRVQPSAGALYPCELYLQARGIDGLENGVYHYEPLQERLRLLYRLSAGEGIEAWTSRPLAVEGLTLLISAIGYRSVWKYGNRGFRYCLLDGGHLVGAVEAAAAALALPFAVQCRLDHANVDTAFGFWPGEFSLAVVECGRRTREAVTAPEMALPPVHDQGQGTPGDLIQNHYQRTGVLDGCRPCQRREAYFLQGRQLIKAIKTRRSIRAFQGRVMSRQQYEAILLAASQPVTIDCNEAIRLAAVINRVDSLPPGLYNGTTCLRKGSFAEMAGYLCLEQRLGSDSGVTLFFLSQGRNYQPLMLKAGLIGQRIYLAATSLGLGCSGIGAFYDQEVADFLDCDDMVLYAMAVG